MKLLLCCLVALIGLAACGKKGPPTTPDWYKERVLSRDGAKS